MNPKKLETLLYRTVFTYLQIVAVRFALSAVSVCHPNCNVEELLRRRQFCPTLLFSSNQSQRIGSRTRTHTSQPNKRLYKVQIQPTGNTKIPRDQACNDYFE